MSTSLPSYISVTAEWYNACTSFITQQQDPNQQQNNNITEEIIWQWKHSDLRGIALKSTFESAQRRINGERNPNKKIWETRRGGEAMMITDCIGKAELLWELAIWTKILPPAPKNTYRYVHERHVSNQLTQPSALLSLTTKRIDVSNSLQKQVDDLEASTKFSEIVIEGDENAEPHLTGTTENTQPRENSAANRHDASKGLRMLKFTLTDGCSEIIAMEYESISGLQVDVQLGTKIKLLGSIHIARGVLMLRAQNVEILGGYVEQLQEGKNLLQRISRTLRTPAATNNRPHPPLQVASYVRTASNSNRGSRTSHPQTRTAAQTSRPSAVAHTSHRPAASSMPPVAQVIEIVSDDSADEFAEFDDIDTEVLRNL